MLSMLHLVIPVYNGPRARALGCPTLCAKAMLDQTGARSIQRQAKSDLPSSAVCKPRNSPDMMLRMRYILLCGGYNST